MEANFWIEKWKNNEINFHQSQANPFLVQHFEKLSLPKGSRVFLPLCGKTLDAAWLLHRGYRVVGSELVELAIQQLFEELKVKPIISKTRELKLYSAKKLDIFVGDFFQLQKEELGPVDAVYDRAALVALPEEMRSLYSTHLTEITNKAPQLLIVFEYDQKIMQGPPFSINDEEVQKHYQSSYQLKLLEKADVVGGLKGQSAHEKVWLLN
jgi:thiopurine S-methyltransferase